MFAGMHSLEQYKDFPVTEKFAKLGRVFHYLYRQWELSGDKWYEDALWFLVYLPVQPSTLIYGEPK